MKVLPLLTASAALLIGSQAMADARVNASINACKDAITSQAQLQDARYNVKRIKTRVSNREFKFAVNAPGSDVTKATCKVKKNGVVLALSVNGQTLPIAATEAASSPQT